MFEVTPVTKTHGESVCPQECPAILYAGACPFHRRSQDRECWCRNTAIERPCLGMQAPVLLRLVFHDAGTYAAATGDGGANGSLRFELDRPENRGLKVRCTS